MRMILCALAVLGTAIPALATHKTGWGERDPEDRGMVSGADIGLRALRAVGRGGAGAEPAAQVRGQDILDSFLQGIEAGAYDAPHDAWEEVTTGTKIAPIFTEQLTLDIIVSLLAMIATISASASGIGGGGLLVPIYLIVMGWSVKNAVPLSNATIFGNAVTNIIINFPLRHPTADRPLVDFDLALVLIPMELTGSLVGVLLNILFPQWLTLVCLFLLLLSTTHRTYNKGKATWIKENKERQQVERREAAEKATIGDTKEVQVTCDTTTEAFEVINGESKALQTNRLRIAFGGKVGQHAVLRDAEDAPMKSFEFSSVDDAASYTLVWVDAVVEETEGGVDYSFRALFSATEPTGSIPTEKDHRSLIVLDVPRATRHLGKGQPIDTWNTEMVLSWVQTFTDASAALCYGIESTLVTGTDLLMWATNIDVAQRDLEKLGVLAASDVNMIISHVTQLNNEDYMLLVHSSQDLPWGSWNRSAEWREGDEQKAGLDQDGWMPDDPNHPKCRPASYVSSQAYVRVYNWENSDVVAFVGKVTDYNFALKEAITKNDIDGKSLMALTSDDLKGLGVPQLGPRLALLSRIAELDSLHKAHQKIVDSERDIPYSTNLLTLFLSWLMLLVLALLKGGGKSGGQSPVAKWEGKQQEEFCGSPTFWVLWWIGVPVLVIVTYFAGNYLLQKHKMKVKTHFAFHEGDIKWTEKRARIYPAIVIIAGVLAGLLGVGGAMVTGPLMLEMGMIPRVSTATSSFLIIFTTGVAAIAYVSLGQLRIDYAIWFALMGAVGAALGLNIIGMLLKKYNRQSLVIWSLTLVFVLAAVMSVVIFMMVITKDISEGNDMGMRNICG